MKKIKEFFKKILDWFKRHNDVITKFAIFLFGLYFGVISCLLSGHSLIEFNTASAKTTETYNRQIINNYYALNDNGLKFDLGLQNQVLYSSSNQTGIGIASRQVTASLPITFEVTTSFTSKLENYACMYSIKMGSILHELPNNDTYFILNSARTEISDIFVNSGQLSDYVNYRNNVTQFVNGSEISMPNGIFISYTNHASFTQKNVFGFEFPTYLRVNGNNTANSTFSNWVYHNYFYFNTNINVIRKSPNYTPPTKVVSYTVSYEDFRDYQAELDTPIYSPYFKCHSILLDNGAIFTFGMPYMVRYAPSNYEVGLTDTVYIMEDSIDESTYNVGYNMGFTNGYDSASSERISKLTPFGFLMASVSAFFDIELFGDVTLGVVFSLVFGLLLFGVIIKTFLGG